MKSLLQAAVSDWQSLGVKTVGPDNLQVVVGSFSLQEGDDTLWVEVQRTNPDGPWPWSYGVLTWESSFGRELGSVKAYTAKAGEVFRLGVGKAPRATAGTIYYEPRSFNLAWVKNGYPLSLAFSAASGVSALTPAGGVAFPVDSGRWLYQKETGLVRLQLD